MPEPKEKSEQLVREAEHGRSERTPWLVWGGMHLVMGAFVVVILALAFTAYLIA